MKLNIKKGDNVQVMTGVDKGKTGKVVEIITEKYRAIVEGVNIVHKHTKPSTNSPQGGIIQKEASIHMSNLMIVDPSEGKPTRIGRKIENGKSVRYAKKSGEILK
jgi:large subunit ribosomal protein L24